MPRMPATKSFFSLKSRCSRSIPMDISVSKAELGYAPKFSLKEALRDYMDELRADGARA